MTTTDTLGQDPVDLTQAAQGDLLFEVVPTLPAGLREVPATEEGLILGHSETGHHHVARGDARMWEDPTDPLVCYLSSEGWLDVVHLRAHDTHAPYRVRPGTILRIDRQQEWRPEGWARVED